MTILKLYSLTTDDGEQGECFTGMPFSALN